MSTPPPSAASASTTPKLFVRQSSGLVRNVSVTNALFFNVAAFVGVGLTLYPIFYSLADVSVWKVGPFSAYGWAAIITGLFCVLLALIFSSLTSVMPRSGGDYVFTSRILHPFLGWMESWTLVIASVLIIAFEVPLVLRNLQITARIIGIGVGGHFFTGANGWFTDATGNITGTPGFIASLVVLAAIALICVLPTRTFHKVVTVLAAFGVACFAAMFIFGLLATHSRALSTTCPTTRAASAPAKIAALRQRRVPAGQHPQLPLDCLLDLGLPADALGAAVPVHRLSVLGLHRRRGARQRAPRRARRPARSAAGRRAGQLALHRRDLQPLRL